MNEKKVTIIVVSEKFPKTYPQATAHTLDIFSSHDAADTFVQDFFFYSAERETFMLKEIPWSDHCDEYEAGYWYHQGAKYVTLRYLEYRVH